MESRSGLPRAAHASKFQVLSIAEMPAIQRKLAGACFVDESNLCVGAENFDACFSVDARV
jgi:hypothetical protein